MKPHDALPRPAPALPTQAASQATSSAQERDDLFALVAHELRNPLHALSLQLKLAGITAQSRGHTDTLAQIVKAQGMLGRYSERVTLLLDLVSLQPGALPVRRTAVDLAALVRTLCDELVPEAAYRSVTVVAEVPARLTVRTDPVMLTQVLDNLVLNALKHAACRTVRVSLAESGGCARLEVRDDGRGIAPADCERIFGKFGMGPSSLHAHGSGLGLWIVRKLLDALGGTVTLHSTPGQGATFTVSLPLDPDRTRDRAEGTS